MSNTQYLEIDSTYRDRNQFPLPAQFDVLISQQGRESKARYRDPVSTAAAITRWCGNTFDALAPGATVTTTVISTTSSPTCFLVSAPTGELQSTEDFYINAIANNTTLTDLRRITSYKFLGDYDGGTNDHAQICIDYAYTSTFAVGNTVTITDPTSFGSTTNPDIFVPAGRIGTNGYNNLLIVNETLNQSRPITGYSFETHLLTIDTSATAGGAVVGWAATHCFSLRKTLPIVRGVTPGANTTTTVVLAAGVNASTVDDFYIGDFLEVISTAYPPAAPEGEARRIVDYDATTRLVTVYPAFSAVPAAAADTVAILPTTSDNSMPFNYTGSLVSQSQAVCYEIELLNLILPNRTLDVMQGGRIAFYPYVYVELEISSAEKTGPGKIYSNNPNSKKMLFRAAVDDTPTPLISPFIKIDGDGMVQTAKFSITSDLRFSVRMQNGEIFKLLDTDTSGPESPNQLYQISACFSLKRL